MGKVSQVLFNSDMYIVQNN